ncbi:SOUL domain-containing protein [Cephalotus follicularis]|uniref:SOUL domain-containing protein n=1 Tax=Cephalotus follicularis TaxID=3775 RepID=A0A1Q3ARE1_CEPFO|nr:SOUL domain-containing protein [Cephalotus follicularis]
MEKPRLMLMTVIHLLSFVALCNAIESPQYAVAHAESDFEIRLYTESMWMSAPVIKDLSFQKATLSGFHRLFQYIQGANLNWTRIEMTAPVLTSNVPEAGPLHSSAYVVRFYLPVKFHADPPSPLPELNLKSYKWDAHCVAVRKFSGFAKDDNIVEEAEKLATSLSKSPWANLTSRDSDYAYSIAQYDSPFQFIGRVNEVWTDVDAFGNDGCGSSEIATY